MEEIIENLDLKILVLDTAPVGYQIFLENFDTETIGEQKVLHSPMRKLNLFYAKARSGKDGRINS